MDLDESAEWTRQRKQKYVVVHYLLMMLLIFMMLICNWMLPFSHTNDHRIVPTANVNQVKVYPPTKMVSIKFQWAGFSHFHFKIGSVRMLWLIIEIDLRFNWLKGFPIRFLPRVFNRAHLEWGRSTREWHTPSQRVTYFWQNKQTNTIYNSKHGPVHLNQIGFSYSAATSHHPPYTHIYMAYSIHWSRDHLTHWLTEHLNLAYKTAEQHCES